MKEKDKRAVSSIKNSRCQKQSAEPEVDEGANLIQDDEVAPEFPSELSEDDNSSDNSSVSSENSDEQCFDRNADEDISIFPGWSSRKQHCR